MISFNDFGNHGRLGNQMFQYSALTGIADYHSNEIMIPPLNKFDLRYKNDPNFKPGSTIHDCFSLNPNKFGIQNNVQTLILKEPFKYEKQFVEECSGDINIHGYFQSEKYFKHIKDKIKCCFIFKDKIIDEYNSYEFKTNKAISLHIRRGDYLKVAKKRPGFLLPISYYKNALDELQYKDKICYIFSDDIHWCQQQDIFKTDNMVFVDKPDYMSLYLMTQCDYHIITNSTFSWWGAWLSNSKHIIAPKNWASKFDWSDVYCEGWQIL